MTWVELKERLSDEETTTLDVDDVREAVSEIEEVLAGQDTRLADLQKDFDETKEALDKARILNAKYYNNAIDAVSETLKEGQRRAEMGKYFATEDEMEEVFD